MNHKVITWWCAWEDHKTTKDSYQATKFQNNVISAKIWKYVVNISFEQKAQRLKSNK